MGVICFGKTLQKLSLSCQIIHCRSNKMNPDLICNSSSWSKEEDIAFETALAIYSGDSNQFMKIAAAVPGKSLQEIIEHYNVLVEDINDIESGKVPLPNYERMQSCASRGSRLSGAEVERRKGIAWTAEEHRLFLQGLEKYGRGDWRSISRNCVLSRTPTQVASHAQKFFSRLNDVNKAKRRRSIHDITSVNAADITEPSQGQKSDKLKGPCGGQLQWPIADYVTEAMDTGMSYLSGPVTNCMTDAIEGPSAVNPEKFPVGASLGSELNTSFRDVDEFLLGIEDLITVPAEGTSGAWRGVHTRTSPSLSLQPSVAGGTGMYTHPVNNVGYELEDLMTKQLVGATQVDPIFNTASLPLSIADHIGVHGCTDSSSGAKNGFESTVGAPKGGFSVNSLQLPSIPGTSVGGTYPSLNASSKDDNIGLASTVGAPKGGFSVDSMQLPSIPGTSGSGTYPSLNSSSKDDNIGLASTLRAPKGGFFVDSMQLPSIPGTSGSGTYPSLNSSSKDDNIGLASTLRAPKGGFFVDSMQLPSIPGTSGSGTYPSLNSSSKDDNIGLASNLRAPKGGSFVDSMQLPSIPGTSGGGTYPSLNASSKDDTIGLESTLGAPKGDLYVDYMQLPSIPGTSGGGTYPSLNPSSKEDSIFDLEDLFPDHILGFGK